MVCILTRPEIEPAFTVLVADAPSTDRLMNFIFVLHFIRCLLIVAKVSKARRVIKPQAIEQ